MRQNLHGSFPAVVFVGAAMKKLALLLLCLVLASCGKPKADDPHARSAALLEDVSGVWSTANEELITIDYRNNVLRVVMQGDPKDVQLGEVDPDNETVNLLMRKADDNKQVIWTLQRVWEKDKSKFHLKLTTDGGHAEDLGFVRKMTADDIALLNRLYAPPPTDNNGGNTETATKSQANDGSAENVVRSFFTFLGAADGSAAAALVIPEKRDSGSLSADSISSFYGSLREPLRLTGMSLTGNNVVEANYYYVGPSGNECNGHATITLEQRSEGLLISHISANC
jgi:hypothetical protein